MTNDFLLLVGGTKKDEEMIYDKGAMTLACLSLPRNFYGNLAMGIKIV